MKRFVAVLSGLLVMPAFAEVAPVYYDGVIEYSDAEMYDGDAVVDDEFVVEGEEKNVAAPSVPARNTNRSSSRATRSLPTASTSGATTRASNTAPSRAVASRAAANISQTRSAMTRGTATRGAATRAATSQNVSTRRAAQTTSPATTARAGAVSITQTDTVNTPLYTGRVGTRTVGAASVRARVPSVRISNAVSTEATPVTVEDVTTSMDELAQITDFCKAQYTECMDNFCNVLDDNQGRCSCSKNVKNYAKTEEALKAATENLQDVAQKIQYIGLTGDEIETLFAQTEAEMQMQGSSDSSQIKNDLDKIKNMIVDVKSGTASSSEISSGISMDLSGLLDFNIGSTGFDLSGLFGTTTTNTSSISNQRGEELYKTASSRCKAAVLNSCASQGVDIAVITNSYDLEIDKQCVAYERSLTDANDQMRATVRNAQSVLQKARLMVAQQKNSYDLRGCVNALDSCMQDDFVCGTDYENCLDPSGKYIVNGEVVIGSQPIQTITNDITATPYCATTGLYETWEYDNKNAWCDGTTNDYIKNTVTEELPTKTSQTMSKFLTHKIGYISNNRAYGMCASILNKCRAYTYNNQGQYIPNNNVIIEYLRRILPTLKISQDKLISDYAENCMSEVTSCLNQNNYTKTSPNIAVNSCRAVITTCMSVKGDSTKPVTPSAIIDWVNSNLVLPNNNTDNNNSDNTDNNNNNNVNNGNNNAISNLLLSQYNAYQGTDGYIYIQEVNTSVIAYNPSNNAIKTYRCNSYGMASSLAKSPNNYSNLECSNTTSSNTCNMYTKNNTCTVTDTNTLITKLPTKTTEDTQLPTAPSDLCIATGGQWNGNQCDCNYTNYTQWSDTLGCTVTREYVTKWCNTTYGACTGSENYTDYKCRSVSNTESVPLTSSSYLCKWVGTPESGYCTIAKPYCD